MTLRKRLARMQILIGGPSVESLRDAIAALGRGEQPADTEAGSIAVWIEETLGALARRERPPEAPVRIPPGFVVLALTADQPASALEWLYGCDAFAEVPNDG